MKVLALDLGDQWTGSALSDGLKMFARPYKTVKTKELNSFLIDLFKIEKISIVVVGYPQTLKGTESQQTKTIIAMKEELEKDFSEKTWAFWDERNTSKQAKNMGSSKKDKHHIHSVAAALILEGYLLHLHIKSQLET